MAYSFATHIPARMAMVLWNAGPGKGGDGRVAVVPHPHARNCPHRDLEFSDGACCAGWKDGSDEVMLARIQSLAWYIVREYGVEAAAVHEALLDIDLYHQFWKG